MDWEQAQAWEKNWWSNCTNTLFEEEKQLIYANRMGLNLVGNKKTPYVFDLHGASVLDIGGGAVSLLLKCVNFKNAMVLDPLLHPEWVMKRYGTAGIKYSSNKAESKLVNKGYKDMFDEIWIYNVLQHTEDPKEVIKNAQNCGKLIRIFEWLDTPISDGHIHSLKELELNFWLHGEGKVEQFNQRPLFGKAYYGIFPTK